MMLVLMKPWTYLVAQSWTFGGWVSNKDNGTMRIFGKPRALFMESWALLVEPWVLFMEPWVLLVEHGSINRNHGSTNNAHGSINRERERACMSRIKWRVKDLGYAKKNHAEKWLRMKNTPR